VAYTDVFQGVMILFVVLYISIAAFTSTPDASVMSEAWTALPLCQYRVRHRG